jgi:hypothetical protein
MSKDDAPNLSEAKCCATCRHGMWEGNAVWRLAFLFWAKYHEYCEDYK